MSSGFSGGYPDFYTADGINGRSMMNTNNPQGPYRSPLAGILPDPSSQIFQRRTDLTGKRSLAEFQQQFQQQQQLALYLRNVKQRANYQQQASPISPLSPPVDFSGNSLSPDVSSISSPSSSSISTRYGVPIFQQLRQHQPNMISNNGNHLSGAPFPNLVQNRAVESEKNMMNRLQELEKQLLDDNDEEQGDGGSVITNSEWSDTIQSLIAPVHNPISPSPTSSSSSCSSSSASPPIICAKQSLTEAASAISEGKFDAAVDTLTRLSKLSNTRGTSEQRLIAYMASALRSRVNPTEYPPVGELYGKDHMLSIQMLYQISPCFKLGFMAANLAILEAISNENNVKLHVIDFDIGQGGQYVHLLHTLAAKKTDYKFISLKITAFLDYSTNCDEARLKAVGDVLNARASKVGVGFCFKIMNLKISELNSEGIGVEPDEVLAVNFAFRLYKFPDESVTTENLRDEMLRRVKGMSPKVVTVVEQEMNANTAPLVARVTEACGYYGALFESLDAMVPRDKPERVRIEEALSRKMANSVACEGRDRVERCEVFGKWRARMGMAGFEAKRLSQQVADSLRGELNSGTRGNPGFTVNEETGGICFGWMGRSLTVTSAWR